MHQQAGVEDDLQGCVLATVATKKDRDVEPKLGGTNVAPSYTNYFSPPREIFLQRFDWLMQKKSAHPLEHRFEVFLGLSFLHTRI